MIVFHRSYVNRLFVQKSLLDLLVDSIVGCGLLLNRSDVVLVGLLNCS